MFPRRRLHRTSVTAVLCWLLGAGLYAATAPLWQAAGFAAYALTPLAALTVYTAVVLRWSRPAGFEVAAGSFTTTPWRPASAMFIAAGHLAGPHLVALPSDSGADLAGNLLGAASLSIPLVIAATVRPRLVLTPAGLERRGLGYPAARWDSIIAAVLVQDGPRAGRGVRLTLVGPNRRKRMETISRGFAIDYTFLTAAVRHYIEHPEHRAAIGTETELLRLRSAVGAEAVSPVPAVMP